MQDEAPGTHVLVEGLNHDVMDDDIKELFAGVGELKHCAVRYSCLFLLFRVLFCPTFRQTGH